MDEAIGRVLAEYDGPIATEARLMESGDSSDWIGRRDGFLLPVGPDSGGVLNILIRSAKSRSILELGTSYGCSTRWLAEAARHTEGQAVSLELADHKAQYAREMLARAGLADRVDIRIGSALETLPARYPHRQCARAGPSGWMQMSTGTPPSRAPA